MLWSDKTPYERFLERVAVDKDRFKKEAALDPFPETTDYHHGRRLYHYSMGRMKGVTIG